MWIPFPILAVFQTCNFLNHFFIKEQNGNCYHIVGQAKEAMKQRAHSHSSPILLVPFLKRKQQEAQNSLHLPANAA